MRKTSTGSDYCKRRRAAQVAARFHLLRDGKVRSVASLRAAIDLICRRGVANSAAAVNLIKLVGVFRFFLSPGNQHLRRPRN